MPERPTADIVADLQCWLDAAARYDLDRAIIGVSIVRVVQLRLEALQKEVDYHRECRTLDVPEGHE